MITWHRFWLFYSVIWPFSDTGSRFRRPQRGRRRQKYRARCPTRGSTVGSVFLCCDLKWWKFAQRQTLVRLTLINRWKIILGAERNDSSGDPGQGPGPVCVCVCEMGGVQRIPKRTPFSHSATLTPRATHPVWQIQICRNYIIAVSQSCVCLPQQLPPLPPQKHWAHWDSGGKKKSWKTCLLSAPGTPGRAPSRYDGGPNDLAVLLIMSVSRVWRQHLQAFLPCEWRREQAMAETWIRHRGSVCFQTQAFRRGSNTLVA